MSSTKERSHHSSRHSSHSHHRSHHSSSKYYKKKNYDSSSEMERRGENIIYDNVRKGRIAQMIKRSIFVVFAIAFILVIVYFMTNQGDTLLDKNLFNNKSREEEINELKIKIVDYEEHIEYLENRLSKYEKVNSILE